MTSLRIAVRRFDPFARAIAAQFADFVAASGTHATLDEVEMDLNPLHQALIA